MKKSLSLLFCCSAVLAFSQTTWFADDFENSFESYWHAASGDWISGDGVIEIAAEDNDRLLAARYYLFDTASYAIEVRLRGKRAGLYFCLDDTTTNALSHMVRFEGDSVGCGYVNGAGEIIATRRFAFAPSADWRILRIKVNPGERSYSIYVDGDSLGTAELRFPSGYVGLHASAGDVEFDEIEIVGAQKPLPPKPPSIGESVRFNHVRYVRSLGRNVVIYNPELGLLQTLSPDGKLVRQEPAESSGPGRTGAFHEGRIYSIAGDKIVMSDLSSAETDTITERVVAPSQLLVDENGVLFVADVGARAILRFDAENRLVTAFSAHSIGGLLAPRGLSFHREEGLVIADYDKLVFINRSLQELTPRVTFPDPTRAEISWRETVLDTPRVRYRLDNGAWRSVLGDIDFIEHRYKVTLNSLKPSQRYTFRVSPTLRTIPRRAGGTKDFQFLTPDAER